MNEKKEKINDNSGNKRMHFFSERQKKNERNKSLTNHVNEQIDISRTTVVCTQCKQVCNGVSTNMERISEIARRRGSNVYDI